MGNRNFFGFFKRSQSRCYIIHGMKYIGRVVSSAAQVADPDDDVFENHEAGLMFERLALDLLRPDRSFAVLTFVVVHNLTSVLWAAIQQAFRYSLDYSNMNCVAQRVEGLLS